MRQDIPVIVIGGYLGAGKTTLLNHLLRHADGRKIAILVNEFGDLPIDADLIEAKDDEMIAISGGCICCSFGSDMTAALIKLAQLDPAPDYVVIEASGVAMPAAVAASISFLDGFNLGGVVVLADSERIRAQAADEYLGDTMLRQISDADLIVQTKIDLISSDVVQDVRDWLGSANPKAARCDPRIADPVSCATIKRFNGFAPAFSIQTGAPYGMYDGSIATVRMVVTLRFIAPNGPSSGGTSFTSRKNTKLSLTHKSSRPTSPFRRTQFRITSAETWWAW